MNLLREIGFYSSGRAESPKGDPKIETPLDERRMRSPMGQQGPRRSIYCEAVT